MKAFKKTVCAALCLAMVFALCACGSQTNDKAKKTNENNHNFYPFSGNPHKHWLYRQRHCEVSVFFCPFSVRLCISCIR